MKIGIFSGSFNPVHKGHIALADYVVATGAVDEVWLIRSPQNPFKQQSELMDDALRQRLLDRAVAGHKGLRTCDIEDRMPRPSYTVDTLRALSSEHPGEEFHLMIGGDNWTVFDKWRSWEVILRDFHLLVYPRPGYALDVNLRPMWQDRVRFLSDAPLYDISATRIREALRSGNSPLLRQWLPDGVADILLAQPK